MLTFPLNSLRSVIYLKNFFHRMNCSVEFETLVFAFSFGDIRIEFRLNRTLAFKWPFSILTRRTDVSL